MCDVMPLFIGRFQIERIFVGTGSGLGLNAGINTAISIFSFYIFNIVLLIGLGVLATKTCRDMSLGMRFSGLCRI